MISTVLSASEGTTARRATRGTVRRERLAEAKEYAEIRDEDVVVWTKSSEKSVCVPGKGTPSMADLPGTVASHLHPPQSKLLPI